VAQALRAAQQTVDTAKKGFYAHSLHGYFLRAGDDDLPIYYYVDRLRDGATFCIRRVTAVQNGQEIYMCLISFHIPETGLDHQDAMPKVPPPEELTPVRQYFIELSQNENLPKRARDVLKYRYTRPAVFEIKWTDPVDGSWQAWSQNPPKRKPSQQVWMRTRTRLPDDSALHQAAIAYMSDWALINVVGRPHGAPTFNDKAQVTSLDHAVWFHVPDARADDWLLVSIHSPRLTSSRALIQSRFYTRDGTLVASVAQEALYRLRSAPIKKAPKPPAVRTSSSGSEEKSNTSSGSSKTESKTSEDADTSKSNSNSSESSGFIVPNPPTREIIEVPPIETELRIGDSRSKL